MFKQQLNDNNLLQQKSYQLHGHEHGYGKGPAGVVLKWEYTSRYLHNYSQIYRGGIRNGGMRSQKLQYETLKENRG